MKLRKKIINLYIWSTVGINKTGRKFFILLKNQKYMQNHLSG